MEGFKLIYYIILISIVQIFFNTFLNYISKKSSKEEYFADTKNEKYYVSNEYVFKTLTFITNISFFMYDLYFIIIFLKLYLIPEINELIMFTKTFL